MRASSGRKRDLNGSFVLRKILAERSVLHTKRAYDANGNRLQEVRPDGSLVHGSYDEQDRLRTYGDVTFTYTHHGELFSQYQGSACRQYTYDVFGNLRQVLLDNGQVIEYLVDGRNRRMSKKINGVLVQGWLYDDQLRILAELDGQNNVAARFIYAEGINVPELMEKGGRTYRLIKDQLGSVRFVVDTGDGSIWQEMRYDAWGNVIFDSNPGFQPFGFAGGLYDPHTRLVRFGARDYDPSVGRWTAKDPLPLWAAGPNAYLYADSIPTQLVDRTGLLTWYAAYKEARWYADCVQNLGTSAEAQAKSRIKRGEWSKRQGDAWQHCTWNCWMVRNCGRFTAWLFGHAHEFRRYPEDGGWNYFDFYNNREGRECASRRCDCRTCCLAKLKCGVLLQPDGTYGWS